jgi:hypothetical protein
MKRTYIPLFYMAGMIMIFIGGCKKKDPASIPVLSTTTVTEIKQTVATSGGTITEDGGADITSRGVCYSLSRSPVVSGKHTSDGNGTGSFTSSLTGLIPGATYFIRAYATNTEGTAYGDIVSFTSLLYDSIEHTILDPPVSLTSVSSWNPPTLEYNCYQPVPESSSASYDLDMDEDGNPDFRIDISNWYEFHSASDHCMNFMYYSSVSSLQPGDSVAVISRGPNCALALSPNSPISGSLIFSKLAETVRRYWMAMSCNNKTSQDATYYGFKLKKGSGAVYGWLMMTYNGTTHTMTIQEFAYNRTVGNLILAGQQ